MSILTSPHSQVGVMKSDGFYRLELNAPGDWQHIWASDPFTVSHTIEDERYTMDVSFKTLTGEAVFEWDLTSLKYLSNPGVLREALLTSGVRTAPDPKTTYAILSAVQRPDLIFPFGGSSHDKH